MKNLQENLISLGIKKILIADDLPENLQAAKNVAAELGDIQFEFYTSGQEIIERILANPADIDLILTDKKMETEDAGLDVYEMSIGSGIPALIVTSYDHHGPVTIIAGTLWNTENYLESKTSPETWRRAIELFADSSSKTSEHESHPMLVALKKAIRPLIAQCPGNVELIREMGEHQRESLLRHTGWLRQAKL